MKKILRKPNESRKDYLLRVTVAFIETLEEDCNNALDIEVQYDDTPCCISCL